MRLYIMRHGHAEHTIGIDDAQRQLTEKGIQRIETTAQVLKQLDINPTYIYSSPRVRARQTAEIVASALDKNIEITEAMNFGFGYSALKRLAESKATDAELMFVGHEPTLSTVIEAITGAIVEMKPGGFARIDIYDHSNMRGQLIWFIAPKVFDVLGQ